MRVLVVEDLEDLAVAIGAGLRREGMAVDVVLDGNDALAHLAVNRYDVVVLDRDLPGVHGDEVCRRLAAERSTRYPTPRPPGSEPTSGQAKSGTTCWRLSVRTSTGQQ